MAVDIANHTAAVTAGYARVQVDYGAGKSPRYVSRYEKARAGEPGASAGYLEKAEATSDVSQADADTKALAALNAQRKLRYGFSTANTGVGRAGQAMTDDRGGAIAAATGRAAAAAERSR